MTDKNSEDLKILSVSKLNESVKFVLSGEFDKTLKVKGEVSNMKMSGENTYLTLKDDQSAITVVAWRTKFDKISNGDEVVVTGKITCFVKQGSYQLTATKIEKHGIGNLFENYVKSKKQFEKCGYFSKKREFPKKIDKIAILTATEGAAIQDILYVLKNNHFSGEVHIRNCFVQGIQCPQSISDGIQFFNNKNKFCQTNRLKGYDVLLITRGGGSFEDLIGYSSTEAVKALYESEIFTISAVGHETDTMLSDYAADYRAPTPSIAAHTICSVNNQSNLDFVALSEKVNVLGMQLKSKFECMKNKLKMCEIKLHMINPVKMINEYFAELEHIRTQMTNSMKTKHQILISKLEKLELESNYNIQSSLGNGCSVVVDDSGDIVSKVGQFRECLESGQKLKIIFADGEYEIDGFISSKKLSNGESEKKCKKNSKKNKTT